ncbi:MAG TPA: class I SAM-dependent methyltransferase [Streptosporangiaceae bacterium]|nr:class I SAM-dependent methyltransferase [Streptosporangiaceae bacterium]
MLLARAPQSVGFDWPDGFARIPDEEWTRRPLEGFGTGYDSIGSHGYYKNLEPLVAQVSAAARDGQIVVDYSAGTGLLTGRLLGTVPARIGVVNVDPSAKFLRVALEKFASDERVAFRLLEFIRAENRLRTISEVLGPALLARKADILVAANAIHTYTDLQGALDSWYPAIRPGGLVLLNSACVRNPAARAADWLLDETVERVNEVIVDLVLSEPAFARYRQAITGSSWTAHHSARRKVFVPARSLQTYLDALATAGFEILHVTDSTIFVNLNEWCEALSVYHDSVLGWVGGTQKVDGAPPAAGAVSDRLFLIRYGLEKLFSGTAEFPINWTYVTCRRAR